MLTISFLLIRRKVLTIIFSNRNVNSATARRPRLHDVFDKHHPAILTIVILKWTCTISTLSAWSVSYHCPW